MPARRTASQLPSLVQGEGLYVHDSSGDRLLDFTSAGGRMLLGYGHLSVIRAVQQQAELLWCVPPRTISSVELALYEQLERVSPANLNNFFFVETVSKAVERAVLLAQRATLRSRVLVFDGGWHGDSAQTMAMSAVKGGQRVNPSGAGVVIAPFPMNGDSDATVDQCLAYLERIFKTQSSPEQIAAAVIEPILDQGGAWVTPPRFLRAIEAICRRWGILLIANEARSSLRCGEWYASVAAGVQPDMIVQSAGLANGLPLGAVGVSSELGVHVESSYPASVIALAAAQATLSVIVQARLLTQVRAVGGQLVGGLRDLQSEYRRIAQVRGDGLIAGVAFAVEERKAAATLVEACRMRGLWLQLWGSDDEVIGWMPPLTVTPDQVEEALGIFEEALQTVLMQQR